MEYTELMCGLVCDAVFEGRQNVPVPDMMKAVMYQFVKNRDAQYLIIGGYDHAITLGDARWHNTEPSGACRIYDPTSKRMWRALPERYPTSIYYHKSVNIGGGTILVTGGFDRTEFATEDCYTIDMYSERPTFEKVASMYMGRACHSIVRVNKVAVVVGGYTGDTRQLNSAEIYWPEFKRWELKLDALPVPRHHHSACCIKDGILITGGIIDFEMTATCLVYNPFKNTSTPVADMPMARGAHTSGRLKNGHVIVIGGYTNVHNAILECVIYDPDKNTWSIGPSIANIRRNGECISTPGGLVAFGGRTPDFGCVDKLIDGKWVESTDFLVGRAFWAFSCSGFLPNPATNTKFDVR